jgi:hypothetical protein
MADLEYKIDLKANAGDVTNTFNGIKSQFKDIGGVAKSTIKSIMDSWSGVVVGINSTMQIASAGLGKLSSLVSQPLAKAGQFETLQMSLEVFMGSTEAAKERFKELADFTKRTTNSNLCFNDTSR